jgi:nucleotide-binding universal stress UspA family protein
MPTHAHGRFRRFLLGSVTAKVLHDVECAVLTGVHRETVPLPAQVDIRRVVCAVDSDESFVPVVRGALDFSAQFKAALTVIHAVPAADETSDNRGEIELRKYLFQIAEEKFARLRRAAEVDVKVALAGGSVSTVVREAALGVGADLIVIGRGHTQRALGRLRTHAYEIIRNSPCPVLSI